MLNQAGPTKPAKGLGVAESVGLAACPLRGQLFKVGCDSSDGLTIDGAGCMSIAGWLQWIDCPRCMPENKSGRTLRLDHAYFS